MLRSSFMWDTSSLTAWTKSSWPAISEVTTANCFQLYLKYAIEYQYLCLLTLWSHLTRMATMADTWCSMLGASCTRSWDFSDWNMLSWELTGCKTTECCPPCARSPSCRRSMRWRGCRCSPPAAGSTARRPWCARSARYKHQDQRRFVFAFIISGFMS